MKWSREGRGQGLKRPSPPGHAAAAHRDAFPGLMIGVMLVCSIAHGLAPGFPREAGVLAAWLAGVSVWSRLPRRAQVQVGLMLGIGVACLVAADTRGAGVEWADAAGRSLPIITMLAGVAFLRLVYRAEGAAGASAPAPRGFGAYLRTMTGVHLFGAAINLSALVVFLDRLARSGPLTRREATVLGRAFSMTAYYSPFNGGVALALSLVPGVHFPALVLAGVALMGIGFLVIAVLGRIEEGDALAEFRGYPFRLESLWLPCVLVGLVAAVHRTWPSLPVLLAIALLAPLTAAAALALRSGAAGAVRIVARFAVSELPGMSGELTLFLAAGVLGAGLTGLVSAYPSTLPALSITSTTAVALLAGIAVLAMAGVHPLVSVTALIAVAQPASPDPTQLAAMCVMGWGIGSVVSPYSGINLVLAARCGVSSWAFPRWNAAYGVIMVLAAGLVLAIPGALAL